MPIFHLFLFHLSGYFRFHPYPLRRAFGASFQLTFAFDQYLLRMPFEDIFHLMFYLQCLKNMLIP
jgi:hypothetical protein